jgi:hypothetical protein
MVSCSQAVVRGTTGTCRYGETVRMDKYLISFISLQKVTPEMITNEATVENQDEDKASSVPADTSCLKGNCARERKSRRINVDIKLDFPHLFHCICMFHLNAKYIATSAACPPSTSVGTGCSCERNYFRPI